MSDLRTLDGRQALGAAPRRPTAPAQRPRGDMTLGVFNVSRTRIVLAVEVVESALLAIYNDGLTANEQDRWELFAMRDAFNLALTHIDIG